MMLIETKLHRPFLPHGLVSRPDLIKQLNRALASKLAAISAPAGFGKSTLLGQWVEVLRDNDVAVGWLSLDPQDDDPGRFLDYFVAALNRADKSVAGAVAALIRSSPVLPADSVLTAIVNDLGKRGQSLVMVLDDFHHISSPQIIRFLEALLSYAPPTFHLVLASREHVPFNIASLKVQGQVIILDDSDLRFSVSDTTGFLNRSRELGLDEREIAMLQHRTEGWIAGLQLASLSLQKGAAKRDFIARFSGTDKDIAEFLMQEVTGQLPAPLFDFLIRTSILDRFCIDLAAAVTGSRNTEELLASIQAANLFLIPLDREGVWFRYHHLFVQHLQSLLRQHVRQDVAKLHLKAAHWLSVNDLTTDAVHHSLAAGDNDFASRLVESCCMPLIRQSHITRVREWLNRLPDDLVSRSPRLQLAHVWILFHMSQAKPAAAVLKQARNAIALRERAGELSGQEKEQFRAELYALTAGTISSADRSATAARLAQGWLAAFPQNEDFSKGTLANVLGFCRYSLGDLEEARLACFAGRESHEQASSVFGVVYSDLILGLVEKAAGNLHQAFECFSRATHRARTELGSGSYAEAMVGIFEAEIHYEWNEVDRAEALLQHHQQIIEECGLVVHEMTLRLHLARVAVARGRWDEALVILERAERKGMQTRYRRLFASAIHERVRLLLRRGDVHSARLILAARGLDEQTMTLWTPGHPARELELLALARLLVAEQRPEAALRLLDPICGHLRQSGRNRRLAQMRAVAAVASFRAGDGLAALAAIVDTIGLCVQQGAVRSLVDEGDGLQEVIAFSRSRIPSWQGDGETARFIGKLVADSDNRISAQQTQQNRHALRFSAREHEVARLLGQGFKNRELANSLAMAPDTVKWHLKNIFGKLGVSSRTQAVLRLQELGIADLPSHASGPPAA